jgi:acetyltransferase-like isoleucine patch superfamily enzyme
MGGFALVQIAVCGLALLPVVLAWQQLLVNLPPDDLPGLLAVGVAILPSYGIFALLLMLLSATANRLLGWRTPADAVMPIRELGWPLITWVCYVSAIRVVRVFGGTLYSGSPIWTAYLRLNGARVGRRVHVNSVYLSDHNLLEIGDDVVIGGEAHVSAHTAEHGAIRTGRVCIGRGVTIGLGSVIDIDVQIGDRCQVGALSLVPKHSRLAADGVYVGIPVRRVNGVSRVAAPTPARAIR